MKWNASAYASNSVVQQSWARELIARLALRGDEKILDVGCGDGKVTAEIARAVPDGSVTGADVLNLKLSLSNSNQTRRFRPAAQ